MTSSIHRTREHVQLDSLFLGLPGGADLCLPSFTESIPKPPVHHTQKSHSSSTSGATTLGLHTPVVCNKQKIIIIIT